ncbi:MAG: DegV family protein [Anaerolineales bacterium]|jgi:DegV family protein with EDD domain
MSRIAFVTDTTCNLPDQLIQNHKITIVPVYVIFGDQSFKDYIELPPEEFYKRLLEYKAAGKGMPTSSQPTPEDFRACYTALAQQGYTDIISIHVTAKSSGTCQSAELANSMVEGVQVHVIDSTTTSMHMGFMLLEAIEAVNKGGGVKEAIEAIDRVKNHSCLHFTVTDLEHLTSSGRTEGHQKATEAPLSVKPVIAITEGVPKAVDVERTQHLALEKVLNLTRAQMGDAKPLRLAIVNGNIPQKASQWASEVSASLGFTGEPYIVDFGPALAVHFGPGLLGVTVQWG